MSAYTSPASPSRWAPAPTEAADTVAKFTTPAQMPCFPVSTLAGAGYQWIHFFDGRKPWAFHESGGMGPLLFSPTTGLFLQDAGGARYIAPGVPYGDDPTFGGNDVAFTAQTDSGYLQLDYKLATGQDTGLAFAGFRINSSGVNTTTAGLTDYAGIAHYNDEVGSGTFDFAVTTNLNGAGQAYDTATNNVTVADDTWYTLKFELLANGTIKAYVDGTQMTGIDAFTFDSGDVLIPFIEGAAGSIGYIRNIEVGTL